MTAGVGNLCAVSAIGNTPAPTQRPEKKFVPGYLGELLLEAAISTAHARLLTAPTPEEKREACEELISLVAQRSRDRVRFMERMRGL